MQRINYYFEIIRKFSADMQANIVSFSLVLSQKLF